MAETARRDVFQAIADPTRRRIIELLGGKSMNINSIAASLEMSQPAISQQIKVLSECGIIETETIGRERYCKIKAYNLVPAFLWLEQYKQQWTERIDSFEKYVNNKLQSNSTIKKTKK